MHLQADYLRSLNQQGQSEGVVTLFESNRVTYNSETLGEYVKALARLDRLDNSRVYSMVQVRWWGRRLAIRMYGYYDWIPVTLPALGRPLWRDDVAVQLQI